MNVKTRLQISAALPILLAVTVAVTLGIVTNMVSDVVAQLRTADRIAQESSALGLATFRYALNPGDATKEKWETIHTELGTLLQKELSSSQHQGSQFREIRDHHKKMKEIFSQVVAIDAGNSSSSSQGEAGRQMLLGELLGFSQSVVSGSFMRAAKGHDTSTAIQEVAYRVIIGTTAILAAILTLLAIRVIQKITQAVAVLREGTDSVASGDLDDEVVLDSRDELGDLAKNFNRMIHKVKMSRDLIQKEVDKREQVAQELQMSNVQLSDAMVRLKRAQDEIVQRERLGALRQVSRGIVHDMNDLLMPIQGISEFLMGDEKEMNPKDLKEGLKAINDASQRAAKIVRNLGEFFYPTHGGVVKPVDLDALIEAEIDHLSPMWEHTKGMKGTKIEVVLKPGKVPVFDACEAAIRESVINLVANAVEAMPQGGVVTVATCSEGENAVFKVSDTGVGMDKDALSRCWEPFFSTKGRGHSGMGLTAVRAVARRCNAEASVESVEGEGSTFVFSIPMKKTLTSSAPAEQAQVESNPLNILAIDDELWVLNVLSRYLSANGHKVRSASDGTEGLKLFRESNSDLVILDRAMPDISGDEVAVEIKKINPATKIIMLTGFGGLMEGSGEHPQGVDLILSKPVTREELVHAVSSLSA